MLTLNGDRPACKVYVTLVVHLCVKNNLVTSLDNIFPSLGVGGGKSLAYSMVLARHIESLFLPELNIKLLV